MGNSVEHIEIKGVEVPIIFEEQKNLPIVSLQLVFSGGGSMSNGGIDGLSRFSSSMLNEGTLDLGSTKFANELDKRAINLYVNSGSQTLVYELSSLSEEFGFGAKMLKDLLRDPNLSSETFAKVKTQTLGIISNKESDFDYIANSKLISLMFENTPLSTIALGTKDSLEKITLKKVEEFISSQVNLNNLIIVIGGDINKTDTTSLLKDILSTLEVGNKTQLKNYTVSSNAKSVTQIRQSEQAYIYFGAPLFVTFDNSDTYKAKVASFILGEGGFGSRLMEEVRVKRGLAYSAYARFVIDKSSSSMSGYLQTKNESKDEAIAVVKDVISNFVKNGVNKDELDQAKKFLIGSEPLRLETLSQRLSRSFNEYYRGHKLGHSIEELKKIEGLSLEELNSFIASHSEINDTIFSVVTNEDNRSK